jgi:CRISPR-associated RAMP protein (TIGR02581 family)
MIELRNRYLFEGRLVMQTALHIGGGRVTLSNSDSPIVLTPEGKPYIPGSSFKGALRSTIEKLVPNLPDPAKLRSCGLLELSEYTINDMKREDLDKMCPTIRQRDIQKRLQNATPQQAEKITKAIYDKLCHTCRLFGSPYAASHINVNDLYLAKDDKKEDEWSGVVQVRDGVGIDRDSETAKDGAKYDFEVVPSNAVFALSITLENATEEDLQLELVSVGLSEFVHGFGMIGGKRSRGLGACRLTGLKVSSLELDNKVAEPVRNERLKNYLLNRTFSNEEPGDSFLQRHIKLIFD